MELSDEKQNIPFEELWPRLAAATNKGLLIQHGTLPDGTPRYQFEFVDSQEVNAYAVEYFGVAMLCMTIPLGTMLWEMSDALSYNTMIRKRFGIQTLEHQQMLHVEIFSTVQGFVVGHEYGHHSLSHHVHASMTTSFFSDLDNGQGGSIEDQGKEIHADGLSVYFGIYGLIAGDRRALTNKSFGAATTDQLLLSLYIIGVVSFLFLRPPTTFDPSTIETLTHPPSAIRLEFIMRHIKRWCEESRRNLLPFLTLQLFQELVREVRETLWRGHGPAWPEQDAFNRSPEGIAYGQKLASSYDSLQKRSRGDDDRGGLS